MPRRCNALLLLVVCCYPTLWAQGDRDLRIERSTQRKALLIGNDAYAQVPLRGAVHDARALDVVLSKQGFESLVLTDATLRQIDDAVDRFVQQLRPGDVALFYYAGHGIQLEGENYLVPIDFRGRDEADAKYESYSISRIQDRMHAAGASLKILILDACRTNPFRLSRSAGGGLAAMNTGRGTYIAFATAPGKVAVETTNAGGLFTSSLIRALGRPGWSLNEIFDHVRADVDEQTKGQQLPWTASSVIGNFYFTVGDRRESAPTPAKPVPAITERAKAQVSSRPRTSQEEALFQSANASARGKRYDNAIRDFGALLETNPTDAGAWMGRGHAYYRIGQLARAKDDLTRALELSPGDLNAHMNRAMVHKSLGEFGRALADIDEALKIRPSSPIWMERSLVHLEQREYAAAIEDSNQVLKQSPGHAWAMNNRGYARMMLREFTAALADFNVALAADSKNVKALRNRSQLYFRLGETDRGLADLVEAAKIDGGQVPERTIRRQTVIAPELEGVWMGELSAGRKLRINLELRNSPKGVGIGLLDSPDQNVRGIPLTGVVQKGSSLSLEFINIPATFKAQLKPSTSELRGMWHQHGRDIDLVLKKVSN